MTNTEMKKTLTAIFPFLKWISTVKTSWKDDLFAGLTGAVVVLPQGVAFAMIAGMPPEYGLYSAMIPAVIAALFGSSKHLISGPTTAISLVIFASISAITEPGSNYYIELTLLLTLMTGVFQFILGAARLGGLINFVSHSVVIGFTTGAAILIASSQLKHLFGLQYKNAAHFVDNIGLLIKNVHDLNIYSLMTAAVTLFIVLFVRKVRPKWPSMLFAMVGGAVLAVSMGWQGKGVKVVGALPSAIPHFVLPHLSLDSIRVLSTPAMAIAMLGLMEAVSIARSIAMKSGQKIDGNQEFIGQGLSNIVGSLFSAYASSGSFTRSGVNYSAGAKTPAAAIFAAAWLMAILMFVVSYAAYLPIASMAAVILVVAYNLVDFHHIRTTFRLSKQDTAVMLVTFLSTLFLELEFAIYVGALLSIGLFLNKTAQPKVLPRVPEIHNRQLVTDPFLPQCPQMGMIMIDGDLYFAAMSHVEENITRLQAFTPTQHTLLIICSSINQIDLSGVESLVHMVDEYRRNNKDIYFCGIKPPMMKLMEKSGAVEEIRHDHIFESKEQAIETLVSMQDTGVCSECPHRVFWECDAKKAAAKATAKEVAFGLPQSGLLQS
ncbi:MAG: SulP family inorganic anion transporter [Candidatus Magnetominusculus sp. LBB02]|nr:SulP family inorganic anion transporter [Candidatus Magnetominusculus sp. LBB02]